jgi:hypothetical protein
MCYISNNIEHQTHRGRQESDHKIQNHNDAEMNGVDPQLLADWEKNRDQDNHCGNWFKKTPDEE